MDREAELDFDRALILYRAARAVDPSSFLAHERYMAFMVGRDYPEVRREYRAMSGDDTAIAACLSAVAEMRRDDPTRLVETLMELERRGDATVCSAVHLATAASQLRPVREWRPRALELYARAVRYRPRLAGVWIQYAGVLQAESRLDEAEAVLKEGIRHCPHPMQRVVLYMHLASLALARGDTGAAEAIRRAVGAAAARDGRPAVRLIYAERRVVYEGQRSGGDGAVRERFLFEQVELARRYGAPASEIGGLLGIAWGRLDGGDPASALPLLDGAVQLADRLNVPYHQLIAYTQRGRAYTRIGRLREAERDLLHAIEVAPAAGERYWLADAHHHLTHVYEGMGDEALALRAASRFVEVARPLRHSNISMISLYDAGIIRWKAGLNAAANAAFDEMVEVIDRHQDNRYWAGEYYERAGELRRALRYYRQGIDDAGSTDSTNDIPRLLAGTARVYEALGLLDSAEAAAARHDEETGRWTPRQAPLRPHVLARRGRLDEAVEISRRWADTQLERGNVSGAAVAQLQLADLLLQRNRPDDALIEAERAESLSVSLNLTGELIEALRLAGFARLEMGQTEPALRLLRRAVSEAEAHPTVDLLLKTNLALGDALAETGRPAGALAAYDRAARAVEGVTGRLPEDLDRARYRDRHLAPFDGALQALLAQLPNDQVVEHVVEWSQRRKAAALALAVRAGRDAAAALPRPRSTAELRQRLRADEVLLDFVVLDTTLVAITITRNGTDVVLLPVRPDSLRRMVERLRRPLVTTYVGRLDLARAPFDLTIAHGLYENLLAPVAAAITGRAHLIVVPDGFLHYVPFEALVVRLSSATAGGRASRYEQPGYVIDRHEVSYLPSAQFLPGEHDRTRHLPGASRLLVVAYETPGGLREADAVVGAWSSDAARVLSGQAATETRARAAAADHDVLHFVTHARADDQDPLRSHLFLGRDDQHDGYLHLTEIAQQRLSARLVVLSACATFSGRLYNGEGLMGLARAFLASGAHSVVATQWPVGPSTAVMMGAFYRALAGGHSVAAALRDAKLAMRRNPQTAHPFYWAGFVLVGGARTAR